MKISQKLQKAHSSSHRPTYSFEFFVPKTSQGVQNLYDRMDRMYELGPQFIDITWNAGGRLSNLTCEMVSTSQSIIGLETCMHLTCTGMPIQLVENALKDAYNSGCQNILALRGDPPHGSESTSANGNELVPEFRYAKDLIKYIRAKYGDYFDIGVAGYPEGHPEESDIDVLIGYLKEKVDAGATFIITQMFYDVDNFLSWVEKCRNAGITVPIIPGIMPISTYASFMRRATWCEINIPKNFLDQLEPISGDDNLVREKGTELVADMCEKMVAAGIQHLHFYTMNLEKATVMVLDKLGILPEYIPEEDKKNPPLPWRQSLALGREDETVRPIFWKNRKKSYVARTQDWDEFPNGRWGDSRSPAYGELENYGVLLRHSAAKAIEIWGSPKTVEDLRDLFVGYLSGKIKSLPWSDAPISNEVDSIKDQLLDINSRGFLTINSQPAVNGVKSTHPVHGWGPSNGYVYQKAYLELLVPPEVADKVVHAVEKDPDVTYYCVDSRGNLRTNSPVDGPNAVTWGIYPGKEVIQPTIVEKISFLAWKDEAFRLGAEWARCYDEDTESRRLVMGIVDKWYLINIVHNDFQDPDAIFRLFNNIH
ncbi:methylenetetrahydrofolate reductase (NAD(P)H) MET13 [Sugiyamaella lignohabitans]|uniref:Methylenetetrahydrofolate reductase (NAD(P)H) MET13 n=1 Tax=Sugiyamaella lignohabitans TaxID=796027 RepID=A0A161HNG2_9ASCO|nr:methylenetetrahydrofolate reductase (NAD(P)H) MET13 [Sugiyamaella lignohabitans]ANB15677.1 methylenetetrahydrofolate reductase (NAD(P)H) MET13 [Sugiyamaella lignohabitans]